MILGHCELKHHQLPAQHAHLTLTLSFTSSFRISRIQIKGGTEYRHFIFHSSRNQGYWTLNQIYEVILDGNNDEAKVTFDNGWWGGGEAVKQFTQSADKVGMAILAERLHSMLWCPHQSEQDRVGQINRPNRQRTCSDHQQWRTEGDGLGGSNPRNSEILTKYQKLRKFYYTKWNFLYQITAASRNPD
jgi:hypothetical protein